MCVYIHPPAIVVSVMARKKRLQYPLLWVPWNQAVNAKDHAIVRVVQYYYTVLVLVLGLAKGGNRANQRQNWTTRGERE